MSSRSMTGTDERASITWYDFREVVVQALRPDFFLEEERRLSRSAPASSGCPPMY